MRNRPPAARRRLAAALVGVSLTLVAGCSTVVDPGAEPATSTTPAPETALPTPEPSPTSVEPAEPAEPTNEPTPSEEPSIEPEEPEPSEEPTSDPDEGATEEPADDPDAELARGDEGARVEELQSRLRELGYGLVEVDGRFGPATQQAVWALQKAAGLTRDGLVGEQTLQALEDGVRPQARSTSGKVIEIDVPRQLVLAVEDGTVQRIFNASSGNGETFEAKGRTYRASTPTGTYQIGRQVDANYASGLELGDMWRPKFFNGGIALHGSASIPPYPASHGCVRLANSAMNWIWDTWQAPPGTEVLVY